MPTSMYQAARGTQDILPTDSPYWTLVESEARRQAALSNFREIRTPTFEQTSLFLRGVGSTTDIVEKEIYSFLDKGGDPLSLRPEGTAPTVRAYLQHGMASLPQPVKLFSLLNAFRHDRPQQGRYREFHQFNVEAIGEEDPLLDAEVVALQWRFYAALGLTGLALQVNSIGDSQCRPPYMQELASYFRGHTADLCADCQRRLDTNPLRLLDDKTPSCQPILDGAPRSADFLCPDCLTHFSAFESYLGAAGIPFTVNHRLVRGLDYYTRSVWEVWPPTEGAQSTLGAGGRYDGLAEQLGGRPTPGVGFATGLERVILELHTQAVAPPPAPRPRVFLVHQSPATKALSLELSEQLRTAGIPADIAFGDRKLGKQLSAANRSGADFAVLVGDEELQQGTVTIKSLRSDSEQYSVRRRELISTILSTLDAAS